MDHSMRFELMNGKDIRNGLIWGYNMGMEEAIIRWSLIFSRCYSFLFGSIMTINFDIDFWCIRIIGYEPEHLTLVTQS